MEVQKEPKIMKEKSFIDIWIKGRFGYAIHAIRFSVGAAINMLFLEFFKPGFLIERTVTFSNPMPIAPRVSKAISPAPEPQPSSMHSLFSH